MPQIVQLPESEQGGGSTVSTAEVVAFVELLRENPTRTDLMGDDNPQFHKHDNEKTSTGARRRTVSAGGRMRGKVAEALGLDVSSVSAKTRAVDHDSNNKPTRFAYWIVLDADGAAQVKAQADETAEAEGDA